MVCYAGSMTDEPLLRVEDVAQRLSVNIETVRRWLRKGQLEGLRLGKTKGGWRVTETDLARFLESQRNAPAP